ncbi:hypothetical protein TRVL_05571 [Trypanosoma vivax]|nr:hypothetical protein TRVL_05571 [Trypanosoma vivax]
MCTPTAACLFPCFFPLPFLLYARCGAEWPPRISTSNAAKPRAAGPRRTFCRSAGVVRLLSPPALNPPPPHQCCWPLSADACAYTGHAHGNKSVAVSNDPNSSRTSERQSHTHILRRVAPITRALCAWRCLTTFAVAHENVVQLKMFERREKRPQYLNSS